jgi:sulfopropanediol 3-dehydrogenase
LASPPKPGVGVPDAILYAAYIAGADYVLAMGGTQAVAALKYGFFTGTPANILVGPGNVFVAEAKRQLAGPDCAIDMFAGPTEIGILADETADPEVVAVDIVSQGEHGPTSPCWLVTTSKELAETVLKRIPELIKHLPEENQKACSAAWTDYGEIVIAKDIAEAIQKTDEYAPEHLELLVKESDWDMYKAKLRSYGSLFVGEGTCVTYGDKASGPNHTLPTRRAAMQSGGLSVHKFLRIFTWQSQDTDESHEELALASAVISRAEGMEGHAWAADVRLAKFAKSAEKRKQLLQDSGAEKAGVAHLWDADAQYRKA